MVIRIEVEAEILRLHYVEKWPVGTIAAHLQVHHDVVTRVIATDGALPAFPQRPARIDAFVPFILDSLRRYPGLKEEYYLADFELSFRADDGAVHLNSFGLFQNYDSWITRFLPWQVQGQSYCHVATVDYVKALARGDIQPGTVITTADDAPVTPR